MKKPSATDADSEVQAQEILKVIIHQPKKDSKANRFCFQYGSAMLYPTRKVIKEILEGRKITKEQGEGIEYNGNGSVTLYFGEELLAHLPVGEIKESLGSHFGVDRQTLVADLSTKGVGIVKVQKSKFVHRSFSIGMVR